MRSNCRVLGLLLCGVIVSGCQDPTSVEQVDLSCASVASEREEMVSCAQSIVEQMSVEQKVAQMIQGEIRGLTADDVKKYGLGSVLNGGGAFPSGDKYATPQDWVDLADATTALPSMPPKVVRAYRLFGERTPCMDITM